MALLGPPIKTFWDDAFKINLIGEFSCMLLRVIPSIKRPVQIVRFLSGRLNGLNE
jgi:hypothetical protein